MRIDPSRVESLLGEYATVLERARTLGERLAAAEHTGYADDDRVSAVVSGHGVLRRVEIATLAKRELEPEVLGECIAQAINRANDLAAAARTEGLAGLAIEGVSVPDILARQARTTLPPRHGT